MSTQTHTPTRLAERRLIAAQRRAADARHLADRRPSPENLNRAAELEAGLARMVAAAGQVAA